MTERAQPGEAELNIRALLAASVLACIVAIAIAGVVVSRSDTGRFTTALTEDVEAYEAIATDILNGHLPYVDVAVEHLPVAVGTMVLVGLVSDIADTDYWLLWVITMGAAFVMSVVVSKRIESTALPQRYLIAAAPLLPLVLFRVEPLAGLAVSTSVAAYLAGRWVAGSVWTIAGSFTKGWPIVVAIIPWKLHKRTVATTVAAVVAVGLAAVALSPGFQSVRSFDGIHSETLLGGLVLLLRHMTGSALELEQSAGAVYVSVPAWLPFVNALPGFAAIAYALSSLRRTPTQAGRILAVLGLAVAGIMLASPLFSTQFLFWLALFVAAGTLPVRWLYAATSVVGLLVVSVFEPSALWWAVAVVAKNSLFVGVVMLFVLAVRRGAKTTSTT